MNVFVLIGITILCTVCGNLLIKLGAADPGFSDVWPLSIINFRVISGALFFGLGLLFYTMLLKRMPLNIAQSIFSVQFIFASSFVLGETIGWVRWVGIALVACGLFIIGWSIPSQST